MIDELRAELTNDPLGRGYAGMTDEQAAASLNFADRSRIRASMTGDEIFQQTDASEFSGLAANSRKQDMWLAFCARDRIDPGASANVAVVQWIFGGGSATVAALAASRQEAISRATELGLGVVLPGHAEEARKMAAEARRG